MLILGQVRLALPRMVRAPAGARNRKNWYLLFQAKIKIKDAKGKEHFIEQR